MIEELGELAHHMLKWTQGIRGTPDEHRDGIEDALADIQIYLLDFAGRNGMDAAGILDKVWAKVQQRDWLKNKIDGGSGSLSISQQEKPVVSAS
jgi:NTP pyrophosphatase (non-canonical NTP hydrolase)